MTAGRATGPGAVAGSATVIIPARLASTRFPEKVLASATGRPMVQHVVEAARRAACAASVVVAADDQRIARALEPLGTRVVMTRVDHPNGTSRLAEAADRLGLADGDVVVNAQGDEPELPPGVLDAAVGALLGTDARSRGEADVGTVAAPLRDAAELTNPNVVKVVLTLGGRALYFSRAAIPHDRDADGAGPAPLRHIGVYAYRAGFLRRYAAMPSTPLERCEKLEQLRVLEHGHCIGVGVVESAHAGIDTPEQYAAFVARWAAAGRG